MAQLGQTFDANNVQPQSDFAPLPAGDYSAMIIDSTIKPTKNGAGQYLELTMQVLDGPCANRLLWDRLTIQHPNAKTVEIAQRQLSAICHAVGVLTVSDSSQLHNRPMRVRVKYLEDQQYGPKNEIGAYKAVGASAPSQAAQPQQPAAWAATSAPQTQPQHQPGAPSVQSAQWSQQPPQAQPSPAPQQPAAASAPPWAAR